MTDIKLESGECTDSLSFGYEDFELVDGDDCLLQDIRNKLYTDIGALFYDPSYGAKVLRYIHASKDEITFLKLKQMISIALKQDNRINENSLKISVDTKDGKLIISIDFKTVEGNDVTFQESI